MSIPMTDNRYIVLHHTAVRQSLLSESAHYGSIVNTTKSRYGEKFVLEYHYVVGMNGTVFTGQPAGQVCPHCGLDIGEGKINNWNALGVCCMGDFQTDTMPGVQYNALLSLVKRLVGEYELQQDRITRHMDVVNTSCPGKNYPYKQLLQEVYMKSYPDVDQSRWSYSGIKFADEYGIMTGKDDGKFHPEDPLTREEMAVILERLHNKGVI